MSMQFSWFPGHMQKTLRGLSGEEKMASMALVILDARCPRSSRNPLLESLFNKKPILYVLNKEDLASQKLTGLWLEHFKKEGLEALSISCREGTGKGKLTLAIEHIKDEFLKKGKKRSLEGLFRMVVVGVPNSGKSSVINLLSPSKSVKTGKKPGLTRGKQWLRVKSGIEVLDTPGVMVPRMDTPDAPWILGAVAAIRQDVIPIVDVASRLIEYLFEKKLFPGHLISAEKSPGTAQEILREIAKARGFLSKGGEPDVEKTSLQLLKMFREGKMGKITLEAPG